MNAAGPQFFDDCCRFECLPWSIRDKAAMLHEIFHSWMIDDSGELKFTFFGMFSQMKVSTFPAIWEKPGDNMERKKKYSRDQNDCTKRGENPFQFWQLERKNFNCLKSHTHPARTRPQVQEKECTLFPNCHIASFFTQSNTACKDKHQILLPNAMLRYL